MSFTLNFASKPYILSDIMPNVVMPSVMAPYNHYSLAFSPMKCHQWKHNFIVPGSSEWRRGNGRQERR
jgi:hypothetical protein